MPRFQRTRARPAPSFWLSVSLLLSVLPTDGLNDVRVVFACALCLWLARRSAGAQQRTVCGWVAAHARLGGGGGGGHPCSFRDNDLVYQPCPSWTPRAESPRRRVRHLLPEARVLIDRAMCIFLRAQVLEALPGERHHRWQKEQSRPCQRRPCVSEKPEVSASHLRASPLRSCLPPLASLPRAVASAWTSAPCRALRRRTY